jgi:AAA+ ATPase superfamily predicted ATPase
MNGRASANPFAQQTMIQQVEQFVGRRAESEQILNLLRSMQNVSLTGARRIGKSSLLYHLYLTGRGRLGEETVVAYTDFRGVRDETTFWDCLCKALGRAGAKLGDFEDALNAHHRVVFCFDEFERVMRQFPSSSGLFDTLRSLAQPDNLALLVATEHYLNEMALAEGVTPSPFFNIFRPIELGLFTAEEAIEFISSRFTFAEVEVTANEAERLLQLAGRFPFFLQLACYRLFEVKVKRAAEWEREFTRDARPHLEYLWTRLKPSERALLRHVVEYGGSQDADALDDLARRGLVTPVQDSQGRHGWRLFSESFEDYIRNPPPVPLRDRIWRWWKNTRRWFKGGKVGAGPAGEIQFERPGEKKRSDDQ